MNNDKNRIEIPDWLMKAQQEREEQKRQQNQIRKIKSDDLVKEIERRKAKAYSESKKRGRKVVKIEFTYSPKKVAVALAILMSLYVGASAIEMKTNLIEKAYRYTLGDPTFPFTTQDAPQLREEYHEVLDDYFKGERPLDDVQEKIDEINDGAMERGKR